MTPPGARWEQSRPRGLRPACHLTAVRSSNHKCRGCERLALTGRSSASIRLCQAQLLRHLRGLISREPLREPLPGEWFARSSSTQWPDPFLRGRRHGATKAPHASGGTPRLDSPLAIADRNWSSSLRCASRGGPELSRSRAPPSAATGNSLALLLPPPARGLPAWKPAHLRRRRRPSRLDALTSPLAYPFSPTVHPPRSRSPAAGGDCRSGNSSSDYPRLQRRRRHYQAN